MTYRQAIDWIRDKVNKDIDKNALLMMGEYEIAYQEVMSRIDKVYAKYLRTKNPQDYYNIMLQHGRLDNLLTDVQAAYNKASRKVSKDIVKTSTMAMTNTYNLERYLTNWIVPEYGFARLNEALIELSVTGTQDSWKAISKKIRDKYNATGFMPRYGTLSDRLFKNKKIDLVNINSVITQGFLQADTYKEQAYKIMKGNMLDTFNTSKINAMRIVQTEGNRTANAGTFANMTDMKNSGIDVYKFWIATLDVTTRDRHQSLDVKYSAENAIPIDDYFEIDGYQALYPGGFGVASLDINCRCSAGTRIGDQNVEMIRRGRNPVPDKDGKYRNEVFNYRDYNKWAQDNGIKAA